MRHTKIVSGLYQKIASYVEFSRAFVNNVFSTISGHAHLHSALQTKSFWNCNFSHVYRFLYILQKSYELETHLYAYIANLTQYDIMNFIDYVFFVDILDFMFRSEPKVLAGIIYIYIF